MVLTASKHTRMSEGTVGVSPLMCALDFIACNATECICTNSEVRSLGSNPLSTSYDLGKLLYFLLSQIPPQSHEEISTVSPLSLKIFEDLMSFMCYA